MWTGWLVVVRRTTKETDETLGCVVEIYTRRVLELSTVRMDNDMSIL